MLSELYRHHLRVTSLVPRQHQREWTGSVNWDARVLGIRGPRGVGKTTLLLQQYWNLFGTTDRCLYISADHVSVADKLLFDIAEAYYARGGDTLIIDEVHRCPDWQRHVKSIIDSFPNKRLWISGSSSVALRGHGADLSRRVPWYEMPGLSFREYLALADVTHLAPIPLSELLVEHADLASRLSSSLPILRYFNDYLRYGYYPFFREGLSTFELKVDGIIEKIITDDIPAAFNVSPSSVPVLRKLLRIVATSKPFQPNIDGLSSDLGIARDTVYHFIDCMNQAHLFRSVLPVGRGAKAARKPAKLYLDNTNLLHTILGNEAFDADRGALRESFFASQLSHKHVLRSGSSVDFIVDETIGVEVGGPHKTDEQFKSELTRKLKRQIVAQDGLEVGSGDVVPLHLFGFLY